MFEAKLVINIIIPRDLLFKNVNFAMMLRTEFGFILEMKNPCRLYTLPQVQKRKLRYVRAQRIVLFDPLIHETYRLRLSDTDQFLLQ